MAQEESSMKDDPALLAALAHGDREALAALYDRHARTLFALAMHLAKDRPRAEDLLHDTFLDLAHHARTPGAPCAPVLRWLVQRLFARGAAAAPG
jgi:RNA polymerase sigma-70 factor (ECF subfamily)